MVKDSEKPKNIDKIFKTIIWVLVLIIVLISSVYLFWRKFKIDKYDSKKASAIFVIDEKFLNEVFYGTERH